MPWTFYFSLPFLGNLKNGNSWIQNLFPRKAICWALVHTNQKPKKFRIMYPCFSWMFQEGKSQIHIIFHIDGIIINFFVIPGDIRRVACMIKKILGLEDLPAECLPRSKRIWSWNQTCCISLLSTYMVQPNGCASTVSRFKYCQPLNKSSEFCAVHSSKLCHQDLPIHTASFKIYILHPICTYLNSAYFQYVRISIRKSFHTYIFQHTHLSICASFNT